MWSRKGSRKGLRPTRSDRARGSAGVGAVGFGADGVGCGELGWDGGEVWKSLPSGRRKGGEFEEEGAGDGASVAGGLAEEPGSFPWEVEE